MTPPPRTWATIVGLLAASAVALTPARAQESACTRALPPDAFKRVVVSIASEPVDDAARTATATAQLFAQSAAEQVRRALGAAEGELPDGRPHVRWHQLEDGVRVVLRRAGAAHIARQPYGAERPDTTGLALLMRAARHAADSAGPYPWDPRTRADSLVFDLVFVHPDVRIDGTAEPLRLRHTAPAFSLPVPKRSDVRLVRMARPKYPFTSLSRDAIANVFMLFVVDSTGRVDHSTVRDDWPHDRIRQRGPLGRHYAEFVGAVTRALATAEFEPARASGCAVRALVRQPFLFELVPP